MISEKGSFLYYKTPEVAKPPVTSAAPAAGGASPLTPTTGLSPDADQLWAMKQNILAKPVVTSAAPCRRQRVSPDADQLWVTRQKILDALHQIQQTLDNLEGADQQSEADSGEGSDATEVEEASASDHDMDELCELIKSKVDSPAFLEKFGNMHISICQETPDNNASWDVVTTTDLWEHKLTEKGDDSDEDNYVLVNRQELADGVPCFVTACLLSLKEAKELTPSQLQEALRKTFSAKKKKSKLRKAWDGSKVIYNVASWGATAIGLYQNPAVLKVATVAFWSSCRVISKFL